MIKATRINQWVANGEILDADQLDKVVRETISNYTMSMFNLFHYWEKVDVLAKMIRFTPESELLIERSQQRKEGTMVVFLHSSNFDVSLRGASQRGLNGMVLSLPESTEGIDWQHNMRESSGIEVKPATIAVLREAAGRLRRGETVVTGIDRPMPESKYRPVFFGRPTPLPVHYIYLALKANVPISLSTAIRDEEGFYQVVASELVRMKTDRDRRREVLMNAEHILNIAEDFIRLAPTQWTVLHPLWPEESENLPN